VQQVREQSAVALRVPVTGVGLATSVGRSAPAACAAIRAGLSRPSPLRVTALDLDTFDDQPVVGHPATGLTEGFQLVACWLRLARAALADLVSAARLPPPGDAGFWGRTALLAALPAASGPRFQVEDGDPAALGEAFLPRLLRGAGLAVDPSRVRSLPLGHAATAEAVRLAAAELGGGLVDRALVLAVDSYLDPLTIQWLARERRLKTVEAPTGLAPGEAAACLLLENEGSARRRQARVRGIVAGLSMGKGLPRFGGDRPDSGEALAACVTAALAAAVPAASFSGDVVADLNGETWRALEWGGAIARLGKRLGDVALHLPAMSLGDTGAASGAVSACYALHLFGRRCARERTALVISSADAAEVACLALEGSAA
jgi:3-oxoacyl-[acyl-carrier-protein] synthase-1